MHVLLQTLSDLYLGNEPERTLPSDLLRQHIKAIDKKKTVWVGAGFSVSKNLFLKEQQRNIFT